ncbi:DTW domain-containing protein [Marinomonas mediterranea]|jgi:Uncharacterized conserved protein|uniref:tRNA-uridine aminocarboxypropyltransferase n=1 Tax=Marinomonas mediterranea (strain ATCC 700492 / JCM 21426 / NBRC 103028 / MMB-1) TaxID=717774 RepID=F2K1H1_MARM1|nr:DTW domain-containing protein [Marinomonas mediterranea]ADZ92201.1 DTW domain containing protein [Marinomonas mediterranea MMB-1]WCN10161.1 DTW domain-containing protein [Marinomonas mediterranea]WCN14206.1 DTW domain-containing protein [Marinomonas mediterranea]WCN18262.1 DTW domain-containing protein [Marinomonas mediterranea MMB-1]
MKFWLLTHSEELKKDNSSGNLSVSTLTLRCEQIIWERKFPSPKITQLPLKNTLLIYPKQADHTEQGTELCLQDYKNIVILDGTWQQAKKMYNQSPYLKHFKHYTIEGVQSRFKRRRNQVEGGLCTAEVIMHLLKQRSELNDAQKLEMAFERFNNLIN